MTTLPPWLPTEVEKFVREHEQKLLKHEQNIRDFQENSKKNPVWNDKRMAKFKSLARQDAEQLLKAWKLIHPVFYDIEMKPTWCKLQKISTEAPLLFAEQLFRILNINRNVLMGFEDRQNQGQLITTVRAKLLALQKDVEIIEDHRPKGFGTFCLKLLMDYLKRQSEALKAGDKELSKTGGAFHFLNRKRNSEQGLKTYFVRKLNLFMVDKFDAPHHEIVASAANAILKTDYSGNDIIKLCTKRP